MDANIRELKAHLSKYLLRVEAGDTIIIKNRNREVARIVPANASKLHDQLCNTAGVAWRGGKPQGMKAPKPLTGRTQVSALVSEERR